MSALQLVVSDEPCFRFESVSLVPKIMGGHRHKRLTRLVGPDIGRD